MPGKIEAGSQLGELVCTHPQLAAVLEEWALDYCCGGHCTVAQACLQKGLDPELVLKSLRQCPRPTRHFDWRDVPLTELTDFIVDRHHRYLERQLPYLSEHLDKVVRAHGPRHSQLFELSRLFGFLKRSVRERIDHEERLVFPRVRELVSGNARWQPMFEDERPIAGYLSRLRELTDGYRAPADACNTIVLLYAGLAELELELHRHLHLENNVLKPRLRALLQ